MSLFFVGVGIPATVLMFALGLYGLYADVNEAFWSGVLVCGLITLVSVVAGLRSEDLRYDSRSTTRSFRVMGYSHLLMLLVFLVPIFGIFKTSGVGMVVLVLALFCLF